jgi:hypothetical protein
MPSLWTYNDRTRVNGILKTEFLLGRPQDLEQARQMVKQSPPACLSGWRNNDSYQITENAHIATIGGTTTRRK